MGKVILRKNGVETQYINGEDFTTLTPQSGVYSVGVDLATGYFEKLNPDGSIINLEQDITGSTNTNVVTYSGLVNHITGGTLDAGSFYLITDFQTCYDQPDFDLFDSDIIIGNYKQGPVKPILVLATSANTISEIAYQPAYPKDRILYDWTFNQTEVTSGVAFGRISERIDEFNNRTDYDHRDVLFRRYVNYYYEEKDIAEGTIELIQNTGEVIGTDTEFSNYNIGDYIAIPNSSELFFEIVSISADTSMVVSGLTIPAVSAGASFYSAQRDGLTYKQNNISIQYTEHPTFLFDDETIISNYIGDVASFIDWGGNTFLLGNNVFGEDVIGNRIGNDFRNNTFNSDVEHNVIGDQFEYNTIYNDEDFTDNQIAANFRYNLIICDNFNDNVIGDNCNNNKIFNNINFVDNQIGVGFNNNTIYDDFEDNKIGNGFDSNVIDGSFNDNSIGNEFNNNEIFPQFYDNLIANEFNNNTIYSDFYKNQILDNFNGNVIGDFGNSGNFDFYRNYIRNNFNENIIRQEFQNNQIGTNFEENEINGPSQGNTILNGFNNNTIGSYFNLNNIGNAFNNNTIYDEFQYNSTDYYFYNNVISNQFSTNNIGTGFQNNNPSNLDLFGWSDLSTVSTRTYDTFYNSLNGDFGKILGKELVMEVTSTSQYFKIKFTQWSTNDNGFQYTREEIDSSGNSLGPVITFTLVNGGTDVDYIVPGDVEITRSGTDPIYNSFAEPGWDSSVSPSGTSWNSIYTEPNNGENFSYNKIGNGFAQNTIGNDFGSGGGQAQGNVINDFFQNNTIGQFMYNNVIGNYFTNNTIGDNFEDNTIKNYFIGNSILNGFESNEIGNYFGNDGSGPGSPVQNIIFDDFKYNKIGNFFGNDTNYPTVGGGSNGDGGNIINNGFQFNVIGDNVLFNALNLNFTNNKIGNDFWLNVFGSNNNNNTIGNLFVGNSGISGFPTEIGDNFISNNLGNYSAFNEIDTDFQYNKVGHFFGNAGSGTQNIISTGFTNNNISNYFGDDGSQTSGGNNIGINFTLNEIDSLFYSNTIGDDFNNNAVGNEFITNTVGDNFRRNQIDSSPSSIDFTTGATHVYGDYNCIIFKRPDSTLRLSYYDNSDVLNITNIDA
jgi:hypothetical protein